MFINRTVEHRGHKLNCRDPYGFWDIDGDMTNTFTTVSKAKDYVDNMLLLREKAKVEKAKQSVPKTTVKE